MIRSFSYSHETKRMETPGIAELPRHIADRGRMLWVDLEDPTDEETGVLGGIFGFHVLSVEDCLRTGQLPRFNQYDGYTFLIVHGLDAQRGDGPGFFSTQQVAVFVGENYLVTYHGKHVNGIFNSRGQVAKNPGSLLRSPDWLLHGLLEALLEDVEPTIDHLEEGLAGLCSSLNSATIPDVAVDVGRTRGQLDHLARVSGRHQDVLRQLDAPDRGLIADENRVYFRSLYDRTTGLALLAEQGLQRLGAGVETHSLLVSGRTKAAAVLFAAVVSITLPLLLVIAYYGIYRTMATPAWGNADTGVVGIVVLLVAAVAIALRKKRWI